MKIKPHYSYEEAKRLKQLKKEFKDRFRRPAEIEEAEAEQKKQDRYAHDKHLSRHLKK